MATTTAKPKAKKSTEKYVEAIGRRKTAIARVRASSAAKNAVTVNEKPLDVYFGTSALRGIVMSPLEREGMTVKYAVTVRVNGGGIHAQAEAIRHGLSRIIVGEDLTQKKDLKKLGFLKRDSRKKERKHFGFRKARKRKQWKKR